MHYSPFEENLILERSGLVGYLSPKAFEAVKENYNQSTRHYHAWPHALSMISWVNYVCDNKRTAPYTRRELNLAALYHDSVYDTEGSPSNEARSVSFMTEWLLTGDQVVNASKLIMLTCQHGKLESSDVLPVEALFLDCDMASFGEPRMEIVLWNEQNIWAELRQKYTDTEISIGRATFLSSLLEKKSVFLSDHFQDRFELQARRNIRTLIDKL